MVDAEIRKGRFQDKVVIVTGAAGGIGAATARRFAEEGATLVLVDLSHAAAKRDAVMEACKAAGSIMQMCVRGLDYMPPVAPTFGEYLRAIITADTDLYPDDPYKYRVAIAEAFRRRERPAPS